LLVETVVIIIRGYALVGICQRVEANISIFGSICIIYGLCLQVFDRDDPLVSDLIRVCAEYDVAVVDDVVSFLILEHRDADKERRPIVVDLIGLNDAVYELELDLAQWLPIDSLLLVVVPAEFIARECDESWLNLLIELRPLLVEPLVQDEAFAVPCEQVLYAAHVESGSAVVLKLLFCVNSSGCEHVLFEVQHDLFVGAVISENWRFLIKVDDYVVKVFLNCLVEQNLVQGVFEEDVAKSTVDFLRVRLIDNFNQVSLLKLFETG